MIQSLAMQDTLLKATSMTNSATQTANWTVQQNGWATLRIGFAVELNTNGVGPTISLLESDDTVVTNFATIVADRTAEDLTAAKILRYEIDLRKRKKILRLSVTTATATNDNVTFVAIGTLSRMANQPDSTTDMVATTNDVVVTVT